MTPCAQHKSGLHPNDFSWQDAAGYEKICRMCGLRVPVDAMAAGPREAIIAADRDWYIRELES